MREETDEGKRDIQASKQASKQGGVVVVTPEERSRSGEGRGRVGRVGSGP
jgi:hypothetical protein